MAHLTLLSLGGSSIRLAPCLAGDCRMDRVRGGESLQKALALGTTFDVSFHDPAVGLVEPLSLPRAE
jgi:hypothetical protein